MITIIIEMIVRDLILSQKRQRAQSTNIELPPRIGTYDDRWRLYGN